MTIQSILENAIHKLVNEFLQAPYVFFTEADAVVRFHQILDADPVIGRRVQTSDGFETNLVHREYPTFFRFSGKEPTARLGLPASRGHYDTVILNSAFVATHPAAKVILMNACLHGDEPQMGKATGQFTRITLEAGKYLMSTACFESLNFYRFQQLLEVPVLYSNAGSISPMGIAP